jgi:hypothetical protein
VSRPFHLISFQSFWTCTYTRYTLFEFLFIALFLSYKKYSKYYVNNVIW